MRAVPREPDLAVNTTVRRPQGVHVADAGLILLPIPDQLEGERIVLRPYRPADTQALWEAIDTSRVHLAPWMAWVDTHRTPDDVRRWIVEAYARWLLREDLAVGIFERASGRCLGGTGLHQIDWTIRRFEIGYWLRADAQGRGYVLEAVRLVTQLAFETLGANRVEIRMDTRNERSRRVAERAGYTFEGTLRRAGTAPGNRPMDVHVFSLIPEEYQAASEHTAVSQP
ncbi:MAG: GNAT family N-acetyltransferase [Chloroflexi bacterium]|nr:GNAT family N-acetyltransferase [Chloroflexota bacterium]